MDYSHIYRIWRICLPFLKWYSLEKEKSSVSIQISEENREQIAMSVISYLLMKMSYNQILDRYLNDDGGRSRMNVKKCHKDVLDN